MRSLVIAAALLSASPALAHDAWFHGEEVPAWVRADCCGKSDAHHIRPEAVHIMQDGYHIDGLTAVVPMSRALPSVDGSYWGFWSPSSEPDPVIFCFFAPVNGS